MRAGEWGEATGRVVFVTKKIRNDNRETANSVKQ